MRSRAVVKRSIVINGHKTSVSLEDGFWNGLHEIAHRRRMTIREVIELIDAGRKHSNLSSAIRLFVLSAYQLTPRQDEDVATDLRVAARQ